jgi:hypothetical protein
LDHKEKRQVGHYARKWRAKSNATYASEMQDEQNQAIAKGEAVRNQVRVQSVAPGIIHTRIRRPQADVASVANTGSPLHTIQDNMQHTAKNEKKQDIDPRGEYNKLRVINGALDGNVIEAQDQPQVPNSLASNVPESTAVINGGFFDHTGKMLLPDGSESRKKGRPVGASTRQDAIPVKPEWNKYYGDIAVGDNRKLSAGPLFGSSGEKLPEDERFQYRVNENSPYADNEAKATEGKKPNYLNEFAGALTHASDRNSRSAISTQGNDVIMHTMTSENKRPGIGVTMNEWQAITEAGTRMSSAPHVKGESAKPVPAAQTLNLDGGGSVYMGVKDAKGNMNEIARGGAVTMNGQAQPLRPVANVITSTSSKENSSDSQRLEIKKHLE